MDGAHTETNEARETDRPDRLAAGALAGLPVELRDRPAPTAPADQLFLLRVTDAGFFLGNESSLRSPRRVGGIGIAETGCKPKMSPKPVPRSCAFG
jgi:hypothetical protein